MKKVTKKSRQKILVIDFARTDRVTSINKANYIPKSIKDLKVLL